MTTKNDHDNGHGSQRQTRGERLRELEALMSEMVGTLGERPGLGELFAEAEALRGSFVLYQGREIDATQVNYLSGNIPTSTVDHDGDEDLLRDEEGGYYLRRTLIWLDSQGANRPASGRTLVHRLSTTGAILWATTRLNSETLDLRNDAREALRAPEALNATRLFGDGSMDVSLRLHRSVACLVRAVAQLDEDTPLGIVYEALRSHVTGALTGGEGRERDLNDTFNEHLPEEIATPAPPTGELDGMPLGPLLPTGPEPATSVDEPSILAHLNAATAALVRQYLEVTPWDYTAADVVNGCVTDALEAAFENQAEAEDHVGLDGESFHDGAWGYAEESIFEARQERVGESGTLAPDFVNDRRSSPRPASSLSRKGLAAASLPGTPAPAPTAPPINVAFGLTLAQYELAQRCAVADGLEAEDVGLLALQGLRGEVLRILADTLPEGNAESERLWDEAGKQGTTIDASTAAAADRPDLALCAAGEVEPLVEDAPPARQEGEDAALLDEDDRTPGGQQPEGGK